jgi:hydrogenase maturation factor
MRVEGVEEDGLGVCATAAGAREEVDLALVAPVAAGDLVLVHARVALVRLDPGPAGAA